MIMMVNAFVGCSLDQETLTETGQKLWDQLALFDMKPVCTDHYSVYNNIVPTTDKHILTKAETAAIEGLNRRIRHHLARFHRKTFCYSKALYRVQATLTVFFTKNWTDYLY